MKAHRFATAARICALAALVLVAAPRSSFAQLSRVGVSVEAIVGSIGSFRGVDGAYDPRNDAYLMVGGNNAIYGVCVGPDGVPKGAPFTFKGPGIPFGAFPRARYSSHINSGNGGFLVVWVAEAGNTGWGPIQSTVVSCTAGVLVGPQFIGPNLGFLEIRSGDRLFRDQPEICRRLQELHGRREVRGHQRRRRGGVDLADLGGDRAAGRT